MLAARTYPEGLPADRSLRAGSLADALASECRLLEDLTLVLRQQRDGVAGNDLEAIDASVYAAQRVLLTLQQARKRRRTLLGLLAGREDVGLGELEEVVGPADLTAQVRAARDALQRAARSLARELDVNRRVLNGAIAVGDELIRAMVGGDPRPALYTPDAHAPDGAGGGGGSLLNTKA